MLETYTVKEVAEILGLTRPTVYNYINSGKLKAVKLVREYRISKDEVRRLLEGE